MEANRLRSAESQIISTSAKLPATLAVADALRLIKSNSSKWANERPVWSEHLRGKPDTPRSPSVNLRRASYANTFTASEAHHREQLSEELVALLIKTTSITMNAISRLNRSVAPLGLSDVLHVAPVAYATG
jgi:hypothetical protein